MHKKTGLLVCVIGLVVNSVLADGVNNAAQSQSEFVIAPKKKNQSHTSLKETIGQTTKRTFDCTITMGQRVGLVQNSLSELQQKFAQQDALVQNQFKTILTSSSCCNKTLGGIQHELAQLQKKCTAIVEKLIDNEPPFKKASKAALLKTVDVLNESCQQLTISCTVLQTVSAELKKINSDIPQQLQAIVTKLQHQEAALHKTYSAFGTDECLKKI